MKYSSQPCTCLVNQSQQFENMMKNVIKKNFNVFIYKKNGCMFGTELFTRSKLCKQS